MSSIDLPDAETVVGEHWPLHGPYSIERTEAAGSVLAELVRYLNYATGQGVHDALPYAVTANNLLSRLSAAVGGLEQTFRQIIDRCETWSDDPTLYDYTQRTDHDAAVARARSAIEALADAQSAASLLYNALSSASSNLSYLGHQTDDELED